MDALTEESRFQASIVASNLAVMKVFQILFWQTNWWIKLKRARARPAGEAPCGENTDADIYVSHDGETWNTIEVKHRALNFSAPHDYPYPTIFIDRQKSTLRSDGYWIVNRTMTAAIVVRLGMQPDWMVETVNDNGKAGNPYKCWAVSKDDPALTSVSLTAA